MKGKRYKRQQIAGWLTEWQQSGKSIYKYCEDKPFYCSTFYKWAKKSESYKPCIQSSGFAPIDVLSSALQAPVVVVFPNGTKVELHYPVDIVALRALGGC
jgi:hypothetical protein